MSNAQITGILTAFQVRVDGIGLFGNGSECSVPKIKFKMEEFDGGTMAGAVDSPLCLEKLDGCSIKMTSYDPRILGKMGNYHDFVMRGALRTHGEDGAKSATFRIRGYTNETDFGDWKSGDKSEVTLNISPDKMSLHVDGSETFHVDMIARIFRRNGVDYFADERAVLGFEY